ncbi:hypothetical protein IWW50_003745 [Coemansia erecta]|nr:hypothetical protein IWW50_003745 [Coemansia erecta]
MEAALESLPLPASDAKKKKKNKKNKHKKANAENAKQNGEKLSGAEASSAAQTNNTPDPDTAKPEPPTVLEQIKRSVDLAAEDDSPEWVVRDRSSKPSKKSASSAATVVAWNEDTASKRTKAAAILEVKRSTEWSISDVRADRTSQYGAQVESWTGGISTTATLPKSKKRLRRPDIYDTEYDRGRVKKVKKNKHDKFAATINPFQILGERASKKSS